MIPRKAEPLATHPSGRHAARRRMSTTSCPASSAANSAVVPCSSVAQTNSVSQAARALKARENIRRQHRADQIAEMLDAVDVGQRAGDEDAFVRGVHILLLAATRGGLNWRGRIDPLRVKCRATHRASLCSA